MQTPFINKTGAPHQDSLAYSELVALGRKWGWMMALGIIFVALGVIAFGMPVATTVGLTLMLAALLVVGGVARLVHAIQLRGRSGTAPRFFQAIVALVAGVMMFRYPGAGMIGIAIALTFYFFVSAAAQGVLSSTVGPHRGRGWGIASAVCSFLLGAYIIMTFPFSAAWVPGTLLGIDLMFSGFSLMGLALAARRAHKDDEAHRSQAPSETIEKAA